mgnify:CR=1 FL=1
MEAFGEERLLLRGDDAQGELPTAALGLARVPAPRAVEEEGEEEEGEDGDEEMDGIDAECSLLQKEVQGALPPALAARRISLEREPSVAWLSLTERPLLRRDEAQDELPAAAVAPARVLSDEVEEEVEEEGDDGDEEMEGIDADRRLLRSAASEALPTMSGARPAALSPLAASRQVAHCLELNRQLQGLLREQLLRIDEALFCNSAASSEHPTTARLLRPPQVAAIEPATCRRLGEPAFGVGEIAPPPSADALAAEALRRAVPLAADLPFRPHKWPLTDRIRLRQAVVSTVIARHHEALRRVTLDPQLSATHRQEAEDAINRLPTSGKVDDATLVELLKTLSGASDNAQPATSDVPIDWTEVAHTWLPRRSPVECQARWTQVCAQTAARPCALALARPRSTSVTGGRPSRPPLPIQDGHQREGAPGALHQGGGYMLCRAGQGARGRRHARRPAASVLNISNPPPHLRRTLVCTTGASCRVSLQSRASIIGNLWRVSATTRLST